MYLAAESPPEHNGWSKTSVQPLQRQDASLPRVLDLLQMGPWARFLLNSTRAALDRAHDGGSAEPDWVVGRLQPAGQAGGGGKQAIHVFRSYTSRKCTRRCVV